MCTGICAFTVRKAIGSAKRNRFRQSNNAFKSRSRCSWPRYSRGTRRGTLACRTRHRRCVHVLQNAIKNDSPSHRLSGYSDYGRQYLFAGPGRRRKVDVPAAGKPHAPGTETIKSSYKTAPATEKDACGWGA